MFREIRKKLVILGNRSPFKKETMKLIGYIQKKNWVYMNMRLEGSNITEQDLEKVIATDSLINIPIEEYLLIRRLEDLFRAMFGWAKKGERLSPELIGQMYKIIAAEEPIYRKSAPTIIQWGYTPIIPNYIEEELEKVLKEDSGDKFDLIEKAVGIHNQVLRIYPFGKCNEIVARGAMFYSLLLEGMPIGFFDIKEEEYNTILHQELNGGWDKSQLYTYLVKGTLDTLKIFDTITVENR